MPQADLLVDALRRCDLLDVACDDIRVCHVLVVRPRGPGEANTLMALSDRTPGYFQ